MAAGRSKLSQAVAFSDIEIPKQSLQSILALPRKGEVTFSKLSSRVPACASEAPAAENLVCGTDVLLNWEEARATLLVAPLHFLHSHFLHSVERSNVNF